MIYMTTKAGAIFSALMTTCCAACAAARAMLKSDPSEEWRVIMRETAETTWATAHRLRQTMVVLDNFDPFDADWLKNAAPDFCHADVVFLALDFESFLRLVELETPRWEAEEEQARREAEEEQARREAEEDQAWRSGLDLKSPH